MTGVVAFRWIRSPGETMGRSCFDRAQQIPPVLGAKLNDTAGEMQGYMQANAPWQDQSGEARAGLTCEMFVEGDVVVIACWGMAPWTIFLELGTRFMAPRSIIMPTMQAYEAKVRAVMDEIAG